MKIKIRKAVPSDARRISEIRQETWKNTYKGLIPEYYFEQMDIEKETARRFEDLTKYPDNCFVVLDNQKIIAFFYLIEGKTNFKTTEFDADLQAIYVEKEYQHKGIGSEIFNFVKKILKQKQLKNFSVYCLTNNNNAQNFYTKQGGINLGTVTHKDLTEYCFMFTL